jgi:predicted dehydrogenase
LAATAAGGLIGAIGAHAAEEQLAAPPSEIKRKIKLGVVGNGGRGSWIAGLFKEHGGYEMHAVADYFPDVADRCGDALGVDKSRRFSGLSGYKKLIESGVEAVALEDVPYFFPEQAKAAVEAGCHVYMAKPVAVDVPGCLAIGALGKLATQKNLCFLVDYQMPTDPLNIEIANRIWDGGMGKILAVMTAGAGGGTKMRDDPPKDKTVESRLQGSRWNNDIALGGDIIVNFDIHSIDAAIWVLRQRPVSAVGRAEVCRPNPQSDSHDLSFVLYDFDDGLRWSHQGVAIPNHGSSLVCNISGQPASAQLSYWGKSFLRGGPKHFGGGEVESLYDQGAKRNVAAFYQNVTEGRFENPTVRRAVDGTLTAILGREAGARHAKLTMDELIKENRRLEVDLSGLKA